MHHVVILFIHHIDCYFLYCFCSNCVWCSLPLGFLLLFFLGSLFCLFLSYLSIMVRKTRAYRTSSSSFAPSFNSERFLSEKNQETYEKLNILRNVWAERKVILDELDLDIRRNFERRGWLPLLDVDHPPLATLIKKFYSNLSIHSNDSNTQYVKSWIRGEEYPITPTIVASTLGVPKVQHPAYPYDESPPLDDIISYHILLGLLSKLSFISFSKKKKKVIFYLF